MQSKYLVFEKMYSETGRPSIPPEALLKGQLLIALFSIRSERLFCEQLGYNFMYRWFLNMDNVDETFDATTFTKNRDRLMNHEVAVIFFDEVILEAKRQEWISAEHFTVDGTLIEAWASMKSFRKDGKKAGPEDRDDNDEGNGYINFKGEKRSNETHQSTTDPEALLARKGKNKEVKLSYSANVLMENRNGLCMDIKVKQADGYAEREAALELIDRQRKKGIKPETVGGDKGYHTIGFVKELRDRVIKPHIAQIKGKQTPGLDGRTTRHESYRVSQRVRKRIEEIFGWMKVIGGFRKTRYRGSTKTGMMGYIVGAAYNLLRMARLATVSP